MKLKALVLDIETKPLEVYVWGRREQNIALNQIIADSAIIAWSAKWLGQDDIVYRDARNSKDLTDDKELIMPLWKLLDEADIVIGQNSKAFDMKIINGRFIMHGVKPPSPYRHLDTYLIARNAGAFTSNSLEYLSDKLCKKYKKLTHSKFPGQSLWTECLKGNKAAWDEMKRYNTHDVLTTEELYGKLKAWVPSTAPNVYAVDSLTNCGVCGDRCIRQGYYTSKAGKYPRFKCTACGKWAIGKKIKETK